MAGARGRRDPGGARGDADPTRWPTELARYRRAFGRDPAGTDPAGPDPAAHPRLWKRFRGRFAQTTLGPGDGESWLFEAGHKPVLRVRLDPSRAPAWAERWRRAGRSVLLVDDGRWVASPSPAGGPAINGPPAAPRPPHDARKTAPLRGLHGYAATEPALAQRAAELDAALAPHQLAEPEAGGGWALRGGDDAEANRELGQLLGYPRCCVEAFASQARVHGNAPRLRAAAARSGRFDPLLNNLTLGYAHLLPWAPCRFDCAASLSLAAEVAAALRSRDREGFDRALLAWSVPRLHWDDRLQLLLVGWRPDGRRKAVLTPRSLDGVDGAWAQEWLLLLDHEGRSLAAPPHSGGSAAPGATWLPFG